MAKALLLFLILTSTLKGIAQSVSTLMGGRASGLAYASSTLRDEWSLFNNVGGLSKLRQPVCAVAYDARPALPGGDRMCFLVCTPVKSGATAFGIFRFGDALYSEQLITAGYGNQIGITSLGISANYIQYRASGLGTHHALGFNVGAITQLTPHLGVGIYITNLNQPRLSHKDDQRLPVRMAAGFSFQPNTLLLLLIEIEKDLNYETMLKAGMEYAFHTKVKARTGFTLHPNTAFFGLGINNRKFRIDYSVQYNLILSTSHQLSIAYRVEKKRKSNGS